MREDEIMPMTEWKRDTARALKRLHARKSAAQVLTVNGRAAAVILDPVEYRRLREREHDAAIQEAVEQALASADRGAPRHSVDAVFDRLRKGHAERFNATRTKPRKAR